MSPGAKWKLFLPTALAFGKDGSRSSIGPNEVLIYEIELLSILDLGEKKAEELTK